MVLIFSLTDDTNRVLEQQWTDFNRSSYYTRNHLSRCRRILQGTWRGRLPPGRSVERKWYVLLSVLRWKQCYDSQLSMIGFCDKWLVGCLSGVCGLVCYSVLGRTKDNFQEWVLSFYNMDSVDQTQIRLGGKHCYQLSLLGGPSVTVFNGFVFGVCYGVFYGAEDGTQDLTKAQYTLSQWAVHLNFCCNNIRKTACGMSSTSPTNSIKLRLVKSWLLYWKTC